MTSSASLPIIDLQRRDHVNELRRACRDLGFFYITGHGIERDLVARLEKVSRRFFERPLKEKMALEMKNAGPAWRGYFPVGQELTLGKPDQKEGLYFGAELGPDHPKVQAGTPLHGSNLFPEDEEFRDTILSYLDSMTALGHRLIRSFARSLDLSEESFEQRLVRNPTILFRIFRYPPLKSENLWSVGEHTDYGLLTILLQDQTGGLQVRTPNGWIDAPPIDGTFVCNLGDMIEYLTGGTYRSTPHRVRNRSAVERYSFPFFFDPDFDAHMDPIAQPSATEASEASNRRWDGEDLHAFQGTYGDYLIHRVSKVFPHLGRELPPGG